MYAIQNRLKTVTLQLTQMSDILLSVHSKYPSLQRCTKTLSKLWDKAPHRGLGTPLQRKEFGEFGEFGEFIERLPRRERNASVQPERETE